MNIIKLVLLLTILVFILLHKTSYAQSVESEISLTAQSRYLAGAYLRAQLVGIGNMNHIFKTAPADRQAKIMSYSHPDLPIKTELLSAIKRFIDPH